MHTFTRICTQTIAAGLFFQLAVVPLLVDPFAFDCWYKPKIDATYALVLLMASAALLAAVFGKARFKAPPLPISLFLALYAASALLATVCSVDRQLSIRGDYFRQEGLATILAYTALPVLFAALVSTGRQAKTLLTGLACSAVLASCWALLQYADIAPRISPFFGMPALSSVKALGSTLGNANFLGKFLVLTVPVQLALLCLSASRAQRLWWALACTVALGALILTETRSSWFGLGVACCVFLGTGTLAHSFTKKQLLFSLAGFALAGLALITLVAAATDKSAELRTMLATRTAAAFDIGRLRKTSSRLYMWEKALDQIALRPWLGYGPDTHALIMRQYNRDYIRRFKAKVILDRVHNNYLDVALAQGLVGLCAYCGIVASFLVWLWRALRREQNAPLQQLLSALFSAFCGYLANDFFSFSAVSVSPTFWSLMGLAIAVKTCGFAGDDARLDRPGPPPATG